MHASFVQYNRRIFNKMFVQPFKMLNVFQFRFVVLFCVWMFPLVRFLFQPFVLYSLSRLPRCLGRSCTTYWCRCNAVWGGNRSCGEGGGGSHCRSVFVLFPRRRLDNQPRDQHDDDCSDLMLAGSFIRSLVVCWLCFSFASGDMSCMNPGA